MSSWGYDNDNGPANWGKQFPIANGRRQSPIDIAPDNAVFDQKLANIPLVISYKPEAKAEVCNTGKSLKIHTTQHSDIKGGPLTGTYRLEQFHFHWGSNDKKGSEHTLNGNMFAAELHLVHYNTKYKTFAEAADKPDGLAVFGFFIRPGKKHLGMKEFLDISVINCREEGKKAHTTTQLDISSLCPGNMKNYWTYEGSLTTPPLYESVTWIVFKEPIEMSDEQLHALRTLRCGNKCIVDNYRPPVPLGDRVLRASFRN